MNEIPVTLVTYNRPWHTAQVLKALLKQNVQNLYIFSDAPKTEQDVEGVSKTRELFKSIKWTQPKIIYRKVNQGLAKSVVGAVNHVLEIHDRLILLEDDCVPQKHYFEYMYNCLEKYQDNDRVFGVTGYSVPVPGELLKDYPYDIYFYPRIGCEGWGTWKRAWQHYDTDLAKLKNLAFTENIDLKQAGEDIPAQVQRVLNGELNAWTLNWVLTVYLNKGYYIYPTVSQITNIGWDGSGVHCGTKTPFVNPDVHKEIKRYPDKIVYNKALEDNYNNYFMPKAKRKSISTLITESKINHEPVIEADNKKNLSIVHINTHDMAGGAAKVGWRLAEAQRQAGHDSKMLVGSKKTDSEFSTVFDTEPREDIFAYCRTNGKLYYEFDGSHKLIDNPLINSSDILHLHNLHGYYFNPFSLSGLSHVKPTVWTLHDMQAFTGHCAYSLGCSEWQNGCKHCPHLDISPELGVDTACELLADKKMIYDRSHLWLVAPSQWLKSEIEKSVLGAHPVELIYNGIDTSVFRPYEKIQARKKFGIPADAIVIGAVANGGTLRNPFKGGQYTLAALNELQQRFPNCVFVNIGGRESGGNGRIINIPRISDESELAHAYSALDIFLYTPLADNCPLVVLEALSCGIPIVTFGVGGVPELVRNGLDGYVTSFKDVSQIVQTTEKLVLDPVLRAEFSRNARESAVSRFDHRRIARQYENLYRRVLQQSQAQRRQVKPFPLTEVPKIIQTDAFMRSENIKQTNIARKIQPVTQNDDHSQPEVSIILCTKDRAELLDQMLASLAEAVKGIRYEIIVIEGGSDDDTMDVLHKHGVANIYVESEHFGPGKHSWAELYNFGFSKARGKWAMYASDDLLFADGCISLAIEQLNQQKDEIAGGIFFYHNCYARADWDKFGIDFTHGSKLLMNYGLIRLDHFREVGGLDTAYKFYCADSDLSLKLYKLGKELIPLPGCFVIHNNILDVQKQENADGAERDIELYKKRWKDYTSIERPNPRRLLWQDDLIDAFCLPESLSKINAGIEYFWHGLSCWQYRMFPEAKLKFLQALHSGCDHWQVMWYLARSAHNCGENAIARRATIGVLQFVPGFEQAKILLERINCKVQSSSPTLKNMRVYTDLSEFDNIDLSDDNSTTNGESSLIFKIIRPDDVVFDVGANTGDWSRQVLASAPKIRLHCFEPVENIFAVLKSNLRNTGAGLHNVAISDSNGHKTFNYYDKNPILARMSTFYRRSNDVEQRFDMKPTEIQVQTQTLDSFCREHGISHIDYLKIDTEGAEIDVLKGASEILNKQQIKMIQFEYGGNFSDAGITLKEVCKLLSKNNYAVFRIIPEGLIHISCWRDSLENYNYSNYFAVLSELAADYNVMNNIIEDSIDADHRQQKHKIMSGLIFSKDRAMQLGAAIESFLGHCNDSDTIKLHVLYKTSNKLHHRQYEKLKDEFPDVSFIEEIDFKLQTLDILNKSKHIFFMVDDNIFVGKFTLTETIDALNQNPNALGFSLRLGQNTHYSYARDMTVTLPGFEAFNGDMLKYNWTDQQAHFGYPLELSSSVYRSREIKPLIEQLSFTNPNMLEGLMDTNKHLYAKERFGLLCYKDSVTFCNPVNMVQTVCTNRSGSKPVYSSEELARKFEQGERVDVKQYTGFVPNSCHQEVELMFKPSAITAEGNDPLVTVEMVTYNSEKYIKRAIDSILAQTHHNFELLIVDDGSTDSTPSIVNSYTDSRIRYLYKEHKNRWAGTNHAITNAKGEYILAVDSDDFIAENYIEKMVKCAQAYPDADYYYPQIFTIVDGAGELTGSKWEYIDFSNNRILPNCLFEMLHSPIPYPGSLRRMAMFEKTGGYDELENVSDFVFLCKNALKINFKRVDDQSVYFYRRTGSSLSHRIKIRNQNMARAVNDMVQTYSPEIMCPQLAAIKEPALKEQQYYKYLMDMFYKHVNGHMVQFGEYFKKYGDIYKSKLMACASKVNRAASSVCGPSIPESSSDLFEQGIKHLKISQPSEALNCFNKVLRAVGQMPELHYARAVALLQLGRIYDARQACHAELDLRKDHLGAKKLLDRISQSTEACKIG